MLLGMTAQSYQHHSLVMHTSVPDLTILFNLFEEHAH